MTKPKYCPECGQATEPWTIQLDAAELAIVVDALAFLVSETETNTNTLPDVRQLVTRLREEGGLS